MTRRRRRPDLMSSFVANGLLGIGNGNDKAKGTPEVSFELNGLLGPSYTLSLDEPITEGGLKTLSGATFPLIFSSELFIIDYIGAEPTLDAPQFTSNGLLLSYGAELSGLSLN